MSRTFGIVACLSGALLLGCGTSGPTGDFDIAPAAPIDVVIPEVPDKPDTGAGLYARYCALCHGDVGQGYAADNANALAHPDFLATATDAMIGEAIVHGRHGTTMSAWGAPYGGPLDIDDIVKLIDTIRGWQTLETIDTASVEIDGLAERGLPHYTVRCADCHGELGSGGEFLTLNDPQFLAYVDDGYLRHAISKGRAGTPMPGYGGQLTEQTIDDLVALIRSWETDPADAGATQLPTPLSQLATPAINPGGAPPVLPGDHYAAVDDVKAAYDAGAQMVLLDARPPADYVEDHIAGAVSVPFYNVEAAIPFLPPSLTIVCYCGCPHAESDAAAEVLKAAGFPNVRVINEGYHAWKDRGYPVRAGVDP